MTGVSLDFDPGHIPVSKAKDLKGSIRGGCMQKDKIDWIGETEMHIFILTVP